MDTARPPHAFARSHHEPPRWNFVPWLFGAAIAALAWWFRDLVMVLAAAFALAWVLTPLVDHLVRSRIPRPLAIFLALVLVGLIVTVLVWVAVPDVIGNVTQLVGTIPQRIQQDWAPRITRALLHLRQRFHVRIPMTADAWINQLAERASGMAQGSLSVVLSAATVSISIVGVVVESVIVLALSFYMLSDWRAITRGISDLVPRSVHAGFLRVVGRIDAVLGRFVRGQFLVMGILGSLYTVGLTLLHVPAGTGLGVFAGLIAFVPYLGFFIALGLATFLAALDATGRCSVTTVLIFMVAVHLLDILVVTPRVLGGSTGLSPVVVIFSLLAGGKIMGFVGVLVAVPVAAVLNVLLDELTQWYRTTHFYTAAPSHTLQVDAPADDPAPRLTLTQPPPETL